MRLKEGVKKRVDFFGKGVTVLKIVPRKKGTYFRGFYV
jgi:hypothetical protein